MTLPVAVTLKRRFAPLCVFSFSFFTARSSLLLLLTLFLLNGVHEHHHRSTLHTRGLLHHPMRSKLLCELVKQTSSNIRVSHFPSPEENRQLHFVTAIEELGRLPTLGLQIVVVDLRSDTNLF